jgi:hypothetical protein
MSLNEEAYFQAFKKIILCFYCGVWPTHVDICGWFPNSAGRTRNYPTIAESPKNSPISDEVLQNLLHLIASDHELYALIEAWPRLTEPMKNAVAGMVRAATASSKVQSREDHGKGPGGKWHKRR